MKSFSPSFVNALALISTAGMLPRMRPMAELDAEPVEPEMISHAAYMRSLPAPKARSAEDLRRIGLAEEKRWRKADKRRSRRA